MITVTVKYPEHIVSDREVVIFTADIHERENEDLHPNLSDALPYIEAGIEGTNGIIGFDIEDDGDLCVMYDPEVTSWRIWYELVVQAIGIYFETKFDRQIDSVATEAHSDL